ncbi:progesterone receptor-like [Hippoglossus hippoglossus]|uniref:progesterone receptor-like n=1 Tax=Hippoglossus hippoglossus TaxID=8267 RepID=UPI00148E50DA|nr:progesterone receptor-like [Hippoglossus hippoglossus]
MTTARFFFGASLWALLIVDMCCGPVKKGFNPGASFSGSSMYPRSGSNQGAPSSQYSPGLMPEGAYPEAPELAASAGAGSSSKPVKSRGSAARQGPAGPAQSGAGFQSGSKESKWLIAPPILRDEETPEVASSSGEYLSIPLPPVYQAGELSHYERNLEGGEYDHETAEQGFLPPPPRSPLAGSLEGYVSPPRPDSGPAGLWRVYPYYDYMFLTGQYPTGTVSYFSGGLEHGRDDFKEAHYVREYLPYPAPSQPINTPNVEAPANGGSRRGGAAVQPIYSRRTARQPILHAGGYGSNSNAAKHD